MCKQICRLPILKVESLDTNGSWIPLEQVGQDGLLAFNRTALSLKVSCLPLQPFPVLSTSTSNVSACAGRKCYC
jgi:hypothetical protein